MEGNKFEQKPNPKLTAKELLKNMEFLAEAVLPDSNSKKKAPVPPLKIKKHYGKGLTAEEFGKLKQKKKLSDWADPYEGE